MSPRTRIARLALAAFAAAACASGGAKTPDVPAPPTPGATALVPAADPLGSIPAHPSVQRYSGPFARETAVLAFLREAGPLADAAVARLADETGLAFIEGRGPRIVVSDQPDLPPAGRVDLRLVEGVRRPEIRVAAAALAAGEFRAADRLPELVAEAGVLAASPERTPPEWLRRGVPVVVARTVARRAAELVLGGERVRTGAAAVAPLDPAFRIAALQRIGVGERVLHRFLAARLGDMGDAAALREVGVGSMDFLDAAAATEAERAAEQATEDTRIDALSRARMALLAGDATGAEVALASIAKLDSGDPLVDAEIRLVRAESSLVRGDSGPAIPLLDDILSRPERVVRLADARFLRALAAVRAAEPSARSRAAEFARAHLFDVRTPPILADLAIPTQDALDLVAESAAVRSKAATRMGKPGGPVEFLALGLRDGEASVRRATVEALGRMGGETALTIAVGAAGDSDAGVRGAALVGVMTADPVRGLALATKLAGDPDPTVRKLATGLVEASKPKPKPKPAPPPAPKTAEPPKPPAKSAEPQKPVPKTAEPPKPAPKDVPPAKPPETPPKSPPPAPVTPQPPAPLPPKAQPPAPRPPDVQPQTPPLPPPRPPDTPKR